MADLTSEATTQGRRDLTIVSLLCLPAILGGLCVIPLPLLRAGNWAVGYFLAASLILNVLSPIPTVAGVAFGLWRLRRGGIKSVHGKAIAIIVGLAVAWTVTLIVFFVTMKLGPLH